MKTRRRDRIEILGDLLRLKDSTKTQIIYAVGFNGRQAKSYIDFLVERGFCEAAKHHRGSIYHVTPAGKQLLKQIDKIIRLLD